MKALKILQEAVLQVHEAHVSSQYLPNNRDRGGRGWGG